MIYLILLNTNRKENWIGNRQNPSMDTCVRAGGRNIPKNFVLKSGSLKEIAKLYEVSYPTVRLRLDKLIQKIEISDQKEEEPFSTFIKGLAVDARIDLETAKIIIEKYKKEKGK